MNRTFSFRRASKPFLYTEKDFIKCGWLKKQGGTFKTMKRRYFVLVDDVLYYFTNHTRNFLKGQINLRNLELSELEEEKSSGEYSFSILPELDKETISGDKVTYQLSCSDKKEALEWIQLIKQKMYLPRGGGLFGTPLSLVMSHLREEYNHVPRVVFECCQRIRDIGMDEEGIFRKNGQQSSVYQMKDKVDRAKYNFEKEDVHTVCSLLKLYLRELPEPLIPFCHYDSLKAVGYRIEAREDLNLVRDKLLMLPAINLQLLKYLCEFLLEVSTHPGNRMEILSLARVFSPNILRDQDTDPYVEETTSSIISITVAALIKSQEDLFFFEYEPFEKYDEDSIKEEDSYSLVSALSNMNFTTPFSPFETINGSTTSLPQESKMVERVSPIQFSNSSDSLNEARSLSQCYNHTPKINSVTNVRESVERTPISSKRFTLTNGNRNKTEHVLETAIVCERCHHLNAQLSDMTEDRDRLDKMVNELSKTCLLLQQEVEFLRLQLTESRRLRAENPNDLSDVLAYFNINS